MKKIVLKYGNKVLLSYKTENGFTEFNKLVEFIKDKLQSDEFLPDWYIYELLDSDNKLIEKTYWFKF